MDPYPKLPWAFLAGLFASLTCGCTISDLSTGMDLMNQTMTAVQTIEAMSNTPNPAATQNSNLDGDFMRCVMMSEVDWQKYKSSLYTRAMLGDHTNYTPFIMRVEAQRAVAASAAAAVTPIKTPAPTAAPVITYVTATPRPTPIPTPFPTTTTTTVSTYTSQECIDMPEEEWSTIRLLLLEESSLHTFVNMVDRLRAVKRGTVSSTPTLTPSPTPTPPPLLSSQLDFSTCVAMSDQEWNAIKQKLYANVTNFDFVNRVNARRHELQATPVSATPTPTPGVVYNTPVPTPLPTPLPTAIPTPVPTVVATARPTPRPKRGKDFWENREFPATDPRLEPTKYIAAQNLVTSVRDVEFPPYGCGDKSVTISKLSVRVRFGQGMGEPLIGHVYQWESSTAVKEDELGQLKILVRISGQAGTGYLEFSPQQHLDANAGRWNTDMAWSPKWDEYLQDADGNWLSETATKRILAGAQTVSIARISRKTFECN